MRFSKSRYVTVCQQALVTGTVSALALTAAGVVTLDIVGPTAQPGSAARARDLSPAVERSTGYVDTRPVTPTVHEVAVQTPPHPQAATPLRDARRVAPTATASSTPSARPELLHGMPVVTTTAPQPVAGFATVGVTWAHGASVATSAIALQVRTLRDGTWSP